MLNLLFGSGPLDFMYQSYMNTPKVIVVSEKHYEQEKNRAALASIETSNRLAQNQLKQIDQYKTFLTVEMNKVAKKEEEILQFKEKLKSEKEELTQTD
tara:strand:- start:821 stop:1114 length:294 start_codon:yes stop_codon:yes gene_type:complete